MLVPRMTLCTFGLRLSRTPKADQEGDPLRIEPWDAVFTRKHSDDAHAWPYVRYMDGKPAAPVRVPKDHRELGGLVLCHFLFLDYDGGDDHATTLEKLQKIPEDLYLFRAACIHPTKGGMRIVYRLSEPLTTEEYGPAVRGISMDLARITGLKVDPCTDEWWRCFRLPMVTRDDKKAKGPTWDEPYFFPPLMSDAVVTPEELPTWAGQLPWDQKSRAMEVAPEQRPEVATVEEIRNRAYKKALRSCRFKDYIFNGMEILPGRRDQTILAMVGDVVDKTFKGVPESSAEEVYHLLLPAIDTWAQGPDYEKLWRIIQHSWNGEIKKETDRAEKEAVDMTSREVITKEMLKWLPSHILPNDPLERREFLMRHYCLQTSTGAFVITPGGEYTRAPLRASQLPAHFNNGLQCMVDGGFRNKQGILIGGQEILNHYSINLDDVEYVAGMAPGAVLRAEGERRVLEVIPFALRQDLLDAAEFDKDCGDWLDSFNDSKLLQRWLAAALALHRGPVAACYLAGPARVGKSLMSMALAECFHAQPIPAAQAFSEFNGALLTSPVITVDEGLPTRITGVDTADLFRSLVTGTPVSTQKKYHDQINSRIPYRIMFAANSYDMVKKLIGKRTMEPQDRDAFRERILVIETGKRPADFLDSRGAMRFTKDHPKGAWLGGECRLARHMMKLYKIAFEEGSFEADGRLLVEGRQHPAFTLSFDLSGAGRDVVDELTGDIAKIVSRKANNVELFRCLQIQGSQVWLKKRPYVKFLCVRAPARAEQYSVALDRFLAGPTRVSPTDMTTQALVDLDKLLFCAAAEGLDTSTLHVLKLESAGVS